MWKMEKQIGDRFLSTLLFNDQIILANDEDGIHYILRKLEEEYPKQDLEIAKEWNIWKSGNNLTLNNEAIK